MAAVTPMMEQYLQIKSENKNALVFFRLGDFYELFYDDAIIASKVLDIVLTGRDCGQPERAPMCGVPYHAAETYISKLIEKGHKVAVCEQVEDPKTTKTIVKREVVRIVTPGTNTDIKSLDSGRNNYLMCVYESKEGCAVSVADVSTGAFTALDLGADKVKVSDEIARYSPSEIISNCSVELSARIESIFGIKPGSHEAWAFSYDNAYKKLCSHFGTLNLRGFGIEDEKRVICAAGALLDYLSYTRKTALTHITSIKPEAEKTFMVLDVSSRRNLELTETMRDKKKNGSLLGVLDFTRTSMGARALRNWVERPLTKKPDIEKRLNSVAVLKESVLLREELKEYLNTVLDIERLMSKIVFGTANARDLNTLKSSFENLPHMRRLIKNFDTELFKEIYEDIDELEDIRSTIGEYIAEEPPVSIREGGMIKKGVDSELDEHREAKMFGTKWLLELEQREKTLSGIKTLKIKYNKVFGYFIEITNSNIQNAPERYIRKQTLSNCERFVTEELKQIEDKIIGADERIGEIEYELFMKLRQKISAETTRIQKTAAAIASLDAVCSLAEAADKYVYVRPGLNENGVIDIKDGRHPCVERMKNVLFVPNDTFIDNDADRLLIITGPNMAGKSTYMRQVALIVLMAQIGSFVPARYADIGIVDRVFTRVGASDDIATGQSTFMVEMSEVANIINNATNKSLLILDEIGRGTSTFDGLSVAWSVMEHIADKKKLGAKTLFATHYHELTELETMVDGVKNYCVTVKESGDTVVFLRKIAKGGADDSYGIHVAKLAGIPGDIIRRSKEILKMLKANDIAGLGGGTSDSVTYEFSESRESSSGKKIILNDLEELDIDLISPKGAWELLFDIKNRLKNLDK